MLRAEGLTKVFRTPSKGPLWRREMVSKTAVMDLSLEVPPGRVTGLLGLNGAGKSTTIKMLGTLLVPTRGRIYLDHIDVIAEPDRVRPVINLVTGGERSIYWRLTGRENLWYFGQLYNVEPRVLRRRIDALLDAVGLTEAADVPVEQYSKGMKQRLQVARGLINDPKYLFMDEPTLGLDVAIARQLRRMIREMAHHEHRGVLFTSHYLNEAEEVCDYVYVIHNGKLVAEGTPSQIKKLAGGEHVTRLVLNEWTAELEARVRDALAWHGLRPNLSVAAENPTAGGAMVITVKARKDLTSVLLQTVVESGSRILRVESVDPSLEDAIVAIAGSKLEVEQTVT